MGQLAELFVIGLLIVGGFYVYKHPELIDQIKTELGNVGNKNNGGNTNTNTNTNTDTSTDTSDSKDTGGNTQDKSTDTKSTKKSKFVAVYSQKPRSVVRTPSTIY